MEERNGDAVMGEIEGDPLFAVPHGPQISFGIRSPTP